ncbi:MFS transporter [Glutamicibacter sp.]|uniref:MFS transporter n=1 Tax=Glutamicibacter sp. TaxID=1931995 RepID=UPI0028BE3CCD|nr:MFS transporter [Glutamicibacter sp.]
MQRLDQSLAVLKNQQFRSFWIGRVVSSLGSTAAPVAIAFAALDAGGGAPWLGLILALNVAPQVLLLLAGGVLGDRVSRDTIMIACNLVSGTVQAVLALLLLLGAAPLWTLALSVLLMGSATAFFQPASQGSIAQLVPDEQRVPANAVLRLPLNAARVLGPALGGVLVAVFEPGWALVCNAACFLLSVFFLTSIKLPAPLPAKESVFASLKAGFSHFKARRWYMVMVAQSTVTVMMWLVGFQLFGPVISDLHLGGAAAWGVIGAGFAAGLVGGSLIAVAARPRRVGLTVSLCLAVQSLPLAALALAAPLWAEVVCVVAAGVALDLSIVSWSAFFQEQIPQQLQSRLSSISTFGQLLPVPLGYLAFGLLSDEVSSGVLVGVMAAILLLAALAPLLLPSIRALRLGKPADEFSELEDAAA